VRKERWLTQSDLQQVKEKSDSRVSEQKLSPKRVFKIERLTQVQLAANSYFWRNIFLRVQVKFYSIFFLTGLFFLLDTASVSAQVTGPEQDCDDAIAVCQTVYVQNQSYQGVGNVNDLPDGSSCLENEENNSVWYIFTVTISGVLEFSIVPQAGDDYDFALYNLTGGSCADIFAGNPGVEVRCNYAFTNGPTGLQVGFTSTSQGPGGVAFLAPLNVTAGETYALLVDNFSSTSSGYTLDFHPSNNTTASIIDFIAPSITEVDSLECDNTSTFNITFSEPVLCSSLAANGSDFLVTGPSSVTVLSASSPDCVGGSFTLNATITLSAPVTVGGNYSLILKTGTDGGTVEDNCGNNAAPDTLLLFVPGVVNAGFTFTKASSCVADTFRFTNSSTGNITASLWDFGDNTTSNQTNPVHVYTVIDTYSVRLIASTAQCSDTFVNNNIIVTNSFIASFTYSPAEPCANQPVAFTDNSQAAATNYLWAFGDGNILAQQNPSHTYLSGGVYNVSFTIIEQNLGCADTVEIPVFVHDDVVAFFTAGVPACEDVPVSFTDASAGTPASWLWTFPDATTANTQNTSFVFSSTGTFPVQLAVVDSFCGADTTVQNVDVLPRPFFYLGNDTLLCRTEELTLSAYPGADSYLWSTGQTTQTIVFDSVGPVWATAYLDGCPYTDSLLIDERTVDCSFAVVPSGFSPNNDSKNDILNVLTKRVSEYEIVIYNRWGQEVYRGTNNDFGWDGTYKDEMQDMGVFSYVLNWKNLSGQKFVGSGSITLVR